MASSSRKVSCSPTESSSSSSSSGCRYKGVRKRKWGKWVSEIRLPNSRERIWLGSYDSPEKAARAFDAALFCLRGRSASFNFPDSPPDIDGGRSLAPAQIQVAAAQFAHAHHRNPPPPPDQYSDHSGGTVQMDHSEWTAEAAGSSSPLQYNNVPDFGIFPSFEDLPGEYFGSLQPPMDYDDRWDGDDAAEESFLWNF